MPFVNDYNPDEYEYSLENSVQDKLDDSNYDMHNPTGGTPLGSIADD